MPAARRDAWGGRKARPKKMRRHPFSPDELNVLFVLLFCAVVAALSWLGKSLSGAEQGQPFIWARLIGGMLGAAITAFCFGALAIELWGVSPLIAIGLSGPIGWGGGELMAGVAKSIAKRASDSVGGGSGGSNP